PPLAERPPEAGGLDAGVGEVPGSGGVNPCPTTNASLTCSSTGKNCGGKGRSQRPRSCARAAPSCSARSRGASASCGGSTGCWVAEARLLARLDHPGIVPLYDVGRPADGLCYLVSKYVEGGDLGARLRRGRPAAAEAAALVAQAARALHHAHRRGLVHRDVKP